MKTLLFLLALVATANAESFYDARGNKTGSATTLSPSSAGTTTNVYDARGNKTGSATTIGGTTTFYDSRGNKTGSSSLKPR
jgi:YD repeat-containing protein